MNCQDEIAVLGWGSLLWDPDPTFDATHGPWKRGGPRIKLEFSRISSKRKGALTLVIDAAHGSLTEVSYSISNRKTLSDAICDLRSREETVIKYIHFFDSKSDDNQRRDDATYEVISSWAKEKKLGAVIWTALRSNFEDVCGVAFSNEAAIRHIQSLDPSAKAKAAEYIWRAPSFVNTSLRSALQREPWFQVGTN